MVIAPEAVLLPELVINEPVASPLITEMSSAPVTVTVYVVLSLNRPSLAVNVNVSRPTSPLFKAFKADDEGA